MFIIPNCEKVKTYDMKNYISRLLFYTENLKLSIKKRDKEIDIIKFIVLIICNYWQDQPGNILKAWHQTETVVEGSFVNLQTRPS